MMLYLCSAASNMYLFQKNRKRGHKFLISAILFAFSMARVITCVMRTVWATRQHNVKVAIAAQIFNNAGVLIIYLVNLIFAQRILRAKHPRLGWNTALAQVFHIGYALLAGALIMVITATVIMFYTLNQETIRACVDCQRAAVIFLFILTAIPLLLVLISFLLPQSTRGEETFGAGSINGKVWLLVMAACLAIILSGFKLGTTWQAPRPLNDPAWYHSRAAFYCFGYMLEILILCIYIFGRVDKRFHVPKGSGKRRSYIMDTIPECKPDSIRSEGA
jgi:hypothetical protein